MENVNAGPKQQTMGKSETQELVKYMSDLPCYLQRKGRGGNIQEKALNFGVLDWNRLERWKHDKKKESGGINALLLSGSDSLSSSIFASSTWSGGSDSETSSCAQQGQLPPLKFYLNSSAADGLCNVVNKRFSRQDASFSEMMTIIKGDESMRTGHSRFKHQETYRNDLGSKACNEGHRSSENSLLASKDFAASACAKGKMKGKSGEQESRKKLSQYSSDHLLDENCVNGPDTYDFLSITEDLKVRGPEMCFMQANQRSFSEDFDFELILSSDIPHSCPFPCNSQRSERSDSTAHRTIDVEETESPDECHSCADLGKMQINESKQNSEEQQNQASARHQEMLSFPPSDDFDPVKAKEETSTVQNPSRSLSSAANLNMTVRSFSFREVSTTQLVNPSFSSSACSKSSSGEKASASGRAKSSPLRRMLDPLLKPKSSNHMSFDKTHPVSHEFGGENRSKSNEVLGSMDGTKSHNTGSNSSSAPTVKRSLNFSTCTSAMHKEHLELKKRAHLQLASQNGLPLFTFTFNGTDILAAMMRKLSLSGKDDFEWVYTFYSLQVKKSRGWINQGNKNKGQQYDSSVIGHMKVSYSQCQKPCVNDLKNFIMVREFVLFGAELEDVVHDTLDIQANNELVAIVVEALTGKGSCADNECQSYVSPGEPTGCLSEERNSSSWAETAGESSIVVILPGGVHSQPTTEGAPSSLIDRWRSGGSCDCGGWDVGCALRVLSSQDQESVNLCSSNARDFSNETRGVDLFIQGGAEENRHVFSLSSVKEGLCTVDFSASMSLLQAFSICVAILHDGKPLHLCGLQKAHETKNSLVPELMENDRIKVLSRDQGDAPSSYVPHPPYSPAGRV